MHQPLLHRTALVVGGTAGIGKKLAALLASCGASVTVTGRNKPDTSTDGTSFFPLEIDDSLQCLKNSKFIQLLLKTDVLCVCYGPFVQKPLHTTTTAEWLTLSVHDYALPGSLVSAVLPEMTKRGWGRIVLFGGTRTESIRACKTTAAYSGAKTGVAVIAKSVATCYAPHGITCNVVLPGFTRNPAEGAQVVSEQIVAQEALHLLLNPHINGTLLTVDSGWNPS